METARPGSAVFRVRQTCHITLTLSAALSAVAVSSVVAPAAAASPFPRGLYQDGAVDAGFVPRRPDAKSGSQLVERLGRMAPWYRERAILNEVRAGNVPDHLRQLRRVDYKQRDGSGRLRQVSIWVTSDYLALGRDGDSIRVPMTPLTAQAIADDLGLMLPTPRIVDMVHRHATARYKPEPLPREKRMTSVDAFWRHQQLIETQRRDRHIARDALASGHKKDIVLSKRLWRRPERVAIYGWHTEQGEPIQPLCLAHDRVYADYSHGVRLVHRQLMIDGVTLRLEDVLADARLATLVSSEGAIADVRLPTPRPAGALLGQR